MSIVYTTAREGGHYGSFIGSVSGYFQKGYNESRTYYQANTETTFGSSTSSSSYYISGAIFESNTKPCFILRMTYGTSLQRLYLYTTRNGFGCKMIGGNETITASPLDVSIVDDVSINAFYKLRYYYANANNGVSNGYVSIRIFDPTETLNVYSLTGIKVNNNGVTVESSKPLTNNTLLVGDVVFSENGPVATNETITITPPEIYFAESSTTENVLHVPMTESQGQVITGESDSVTIPESALLEVAKATPPPEITVKYTGTSVPSVTDTPNTRTKTRKK